MWTKCTRLGKAAIVLFLVGIVQATASASPTKKSPVYPLVVAAPVGFITASDSDEADDAKPAGSYLSPIPSDLIVGPPPELVEVKPVPEPSTAIVLGVIGLVAGMRRSRRK